MTHIKKAYRISFTNKSGYLKIGDPLKIVSLEQALNYCKTIPENIEKGRSGSVMAYVSNRSTSIGGNHHSDGVVFVDIDNCQKYSDLIFDNFEKLCSIVPNLYAVNFSHSHNLHFYLIDDFIEGDDAAKKYQEREVLWLAVVAQAIKKVLGIDFRTIQTKEKPMLDTHNSRINQQFFLNHSDFKINEMVCGTNLNKKIITAIKQEYPFLFKKNQIIEVVPDSFLNIQKDSYSFEENKNKALVDSNFYIHNENGYAARTVICSAAYMHYKRDINNTIKYIKCNYQNADEMISQLKSLVINNHIDNFYNQYIEKELFPEIDNERILKDDEYLNDVLDINNIKEKFIYIVSNTNTGKTEFSKRLLLNNENTIIVQLNKSLREGKKQGVEQFTVENHAKAKYANRMFTTIDGFLNNIRLVDVEELTILIDEAHFLQQYFSIDGRDTLIKELIDVLGRCKKVIFMSATPKKEMDLFPFKVLKFIKIQNQNLHIHLHPLSVVGKGRKNESIYKEIGKFVLENANMKNKFIVFSDRNQRDYKEFAFSDEYGNLMEDMLTLFNSNNIEDDKVRSILDNNWIITPVVLATSYFSCGDEAKNELIGNEVFNLDEGFSADYITQAIGRWRDAKDINLHLFYTRSKNNYIPLSEEDMIDLQNCFENLIIEDNEIPKLNIIAAKGIRMFDPNYATYSESLKDKIKILKVASMLDYFNDLDPVDYQVFKKLPYKNVDIEIEKEQKLQGVKGKYNRRTETELLNYLLSFDLETLKWMFKFDKFSNYQSYDDILAECTYHDKTDARKTLECVNRIVKWNFDLKQMVDFFGDLGKANKIMKDFSTYIKFKRNDYVIEEFGETERMKKITEKIKESFNMIESIFTDETLQNRIDGVINIECDIDIFGSSEMMDMLNIDKPVVEKENIFKVDRFEDVKKKKPKSVDNAKQKISIENLETGEVRTFESKAEAKDYLNISYDVLERIKKGTSRLTKKFKVL